MLTRQKTEESKSLEQEVFWLHPTIALLHVTSQTAVMCTERSPTNEIKVELDEFVIHPKTFFK